jgi:hypothetical protein
MYRTCEIVKMTMETDWIVLGRIAAAIPNTRSILYARVANGCFAIKNADLRNEGNSVLHRSMCSVKG